MTHKKTVFALVGVLAVLACCTAESPAPSGPVVASELVAEDAAVPGRQLTLGWRLEMAEGWHLYTNGLSDSGFPPEVELELPEGWAADPLQWPAGRRYEAPGGLLDHVYENEVVLVQTVQVPDGLELGDDVSLQAKLTWLACREGCVPGDTTLTLTLPVQSTAGRSSNSSALAAVVDALPRATAPDEVRTKWNGASLDIHVPGATRLEFHPAADCGPLYDALKDAATDDDRLGLGFRMRDGSVGPARGVLAVDDGRTRHHLLIDVPSPSQGERP